jgi:hypothetical protein
MSGTTTGGLVTTNAAGAGRASVTTATGTAATTSVDRPRLVFETEAHSVALSVQDLFMVSIVVLLAADVIVGLAEVFSR